MGAELLADLAVHEGETLVGSGVKPETRPTFIWGTDLWTGEVDGRSW